MNLGKVGSYPVSPLLRFFRDLSAIRLTDQSIPLLLPLLEGGRLRRLGLRYNKLTDGAARDLASCQALSRLHALDLEGNLIGKPGRQALAASPYRHPGLRLATEFRR